MLEEEKLPFVIFNFSLMYDRSIHHASYVLLCP
jgi:hypothetical protein